MKTISRCIAIVVFFFSCNKNPGTEEVLKKSFEKCQSVTNGYYEMDYYIKYMSKKDTTFLKYKFYFDKSKGDSIFPAAFRYREFKEGKYQRDVLYTGNALLTYSEKDSTGTIMEKKRWAEDLMAYRHNYRKFYSPLMDDDSWPLPSDSAFVDDSYTFEWIGTETLNGVPSYHVKMNIDHEDDENEKFKTLSAEYHFWISEKDYLPLQYTIEYELLVNNRDTMTQYQRIMLTEYQFNRLENDSVLKKSSVPPFVKLEEYEPYEAPDPLPIDTIAPQWTLISLKGDTLSLSDFKGKVVLLDFFYKSCMPCVWALPALQSLHEKYSDKGLVVLGINPFDTKEDDIEGFLKKQGVTYTVFLNGENIAEKYRVSGYPTMYLIDKKGKILHVQTGYGEGVEQKLEKIIKENL